MKRLVLISLLVAAMGVMAFVGCERPEPIDPTEGQPQTGAEDSLINQQGDNNDSNTNLSQDNLRPVEHWGAIGSGYYDYSEGVYISGLYTYAYMDIYPQDSILQAVDVNPNDSRGLQFNGGPWSYSMNGDTIKVYFEVPNVDTHDPQYTQNRWLIHYLAPDTMYWEYMGWYFDFRPDYKFYLIGIEQ